MLQSCPALCFLLFQTGDGTLFRRVGPNASDRRFDRTPPRSLLPIDGRIPSSRGEGMARLWPQDGGQKRRRFLVRIFL